MLEIARVLYRLFPTHARSRVSSFIFRYLKSIFFLSVFRQMNLFVCNNYIQVTSINVESAVRKGNEHIKIYTLIDENSEATKPAIHVDGNKLDALMPLVARIETVVLDIMDRRFSLRNNHLFDHQMNVIDECGMRFDKMPVYKKILSKPTPINGTVAYLSNVEPSNYYHWMCRTLPLLRIYQKFFDWHEIDYFYVGQSPIAKFQEESLARAGIDPTKTIQGAYTADRLIVALSSRTKHFGAAPITKENYLFTRSLFQDEIDKWSVRRLRRIYVGRGGAKRRKVTNESDVIVCLEELGFEPVSMDGKSIQEQVEIFANAEAIVAPHGAALTNLLFVRSKTKVIELIPHGYVNNCFYTLANYGNANYFYLQGEKTSQSDIEEHNLDIKVDISKLEKICKLALA